ncbi:HalX domain-containing protein [Halorussus pelagicus]|uniref:HalX domain-containing protein n=1 Tax=Halorussus pelagicus TaxID=2505977 RepID=UPI000FFBEFE2|nr:HalX domain-containing protein [Halorussus pelagicus]
MDENETKPTVLFVEGEPTLRTLYEEWYSAAVGVPTAADADAALAADERDYDAVLTERRLPDATGREIIAGVGEDRFTGFVTSATPDFDLVAAPVDVYLRKPISREQFRATVERFDALASRSPEVRTFAALAEKRRALRAATSRRARRSSEAFDRLESRFETLRDRHAEAVEDVPSPTVGRKAESNSSV